MVLCLHHLFGFNLFVDIFSVIPFVLNTSYCGRVRLCCNDEQGCMRIEISGNVVKLHLQFKLGILKHLLIQSLIIVFFVCSLEVQNLITVLGKWFGSLFSIYLLQFCVGFFLWYVNICVSFTQLGIHIVFGYHETFSPLPVLRIESLSHGSRTYCILNTIY